jgi:hypothetical protein
MAKETLFHHCRNLAGVEYSVIKPDPKYSDPDFLPAYRWLEIQIGFFPLFVAVGNSDYARWNTGYQNQWQVRVGYDFNNKRPIYRKKGEFPNQVLFSFANLDGVFYDSEWWCIVLNDCLNSNHVDKQTQRCLFKADWSKSKWLSKAKNSPGSVELVVPFLDLSKATQVWVRNQKTKQIVENLGFSNVQVKRIYLKSELEE